MFAAGYPNPTSELVSRVMRSNRQTGSGPECRVRSLLHRAGYRYRKNYRLDIGELRVRPDIVFRGARLAVFIDGCFWHCCPDHGTQPTHNVVYWESKLRRNVERDIKVGHALTKGGWVVLRIWEHVAPYEAVAMIVSALQDR
jgi:DNA mismatch endonuclease, patch repair protein